MSHACPQCGAILPAEETCQDRFTVGQLREIEQPAYYAVHHLSVPCYRLQHNGYSRPGWLEVRQLLFKFIYENWTPAMARRQARISAGSGQRTWSFTKGPKLAGVEHIAWSLTIADVRLDTAENYGADVIAWAKSILADSEPLVRSAGPAAPR